MAYREATEQNICNLEQRLTGLEDGAGDEDVVARVDHARVVHRQLRAQGRDDGLGRVG